MYIRLFEIAGFPGHAVVSVPPWRPHFQQDVTIDQSSVAGKYGGAGPLTEILKEKLSDHCMTAITLEVHDEPSPSPIPDDVKTELLRLIEVIEIELRSIKDAVERMP